jgi:hypothetical protein
MRQHLSGWTDSNYDASLLGAALTAFQGLEAS